MHILTCGLTWACCRNVAMVTIYSSVYISTSERGRLQNLDWILDSIVVPPFPYPLRGQQYTGLSLAVTEAVSSIVYTFEVEKNIYMETCLYGRWNIKS